MPFQNDRAKDQPGQGPLAWVEQQAPALKPLLSRGKALAEKAVEHSPAPVSGALLAGRKLVRTLAEKAVEHIQAPTSGTLPAHGNRTRVLPENQARQNQPPFSGPLFPGGNASRALPGTAYKRGQTPVSGPLFAGGHVTRALPETGHLPGQVPASGPLPGPAPLSPAHPVTTGQLSDTKLMNWPPVPTSQIPECATQRVPVLIKASMKRPAPAPPPLPPDLHKKRRIQMALVGLALLALITLLALFMVTPLGHEIGLDGSTGPLNGSVLTGQNPGVSNPIAQATATAIYHRKTDGYDPSFYGSQLIGNGTSSLGWPLGQCTYWSNYEYHRLTGFWVSWNGNADQWVTGAHKAGWNVSQTPHVPSIMVMMPGVQGASGYGHVAVVEGTNRNVVRTSNMNWYANGGGWNRVSTVNFHTGPGIYFVWHT
ncbi:MAG TPA: CHAP domain-containing protein [Ktedonobacteraceae bacterium]